MNMRILSDEETNLITHFANRLDTAERMQLLSDIAMASAEAVTPDGSRIKFEIAGYQRPPYRGQHPYGVEARMLDTDGAELSVLLHADKNGRLLELEFIRWDSNSLIAPRWETLKEI